MMPGMSDLAHLIERSRQTGWATGTLPLSKLRYQAERHGWSEVAMRRGDASVSTLRPLTQAEARPASLSATYGLGAQPLHTDGAHLRHPPDVIVLHAERPNTVATLLWRPFPSRDRQPRYRLPAGADAGVFIVRSGVTTFLTSAIDQAGRFRYDPGCMSPCDERARAFVQLMEEVVGDAHRHVWSEPEQVLVIENRKTLHARAAANASGSARVLSRIGYWTRAAGAGA